MIITIDGPAGTGKSTIAKKLSEKLGFLFFDTGAMYRSFAWLILQKKINPYDSDKVEEALADFDFQIGYDEKGEKKYSVNKNDVTKIIRSKEITSIVSPISSYQAVREKMVQIQREIAVNGNAVFEGRDMGTVVFPQAGLKIFLTATPEVRADRRYLDLVAKFPDEAPSFKKEEILKEIEERDLLDSTRPISPLKKADDAHLIDTSQLSIDEVIDAIIRIYEEKTVPQKKKMRFFYFLVLMLAKAFLVIFHRISVYGREHFTPGPALIAANHASFLDPMAIAVASPQEIHFLARDTLFHIPLFGRLIRYLNSHPVARGVNDIKLFKEIGKIVDSGEKVLLFPEGLRTETGELSPLRPGLGFLAWRAKCAVLPVYVHGTYDAWSRHRKLPRLFVKVVCVFGSPIRFEEFAHLEKREAMEMLTERTFTALNNLKSWYEKGAVGSPP